MSPYGRHSMRPYATKRYVRHELNKSKWSSIQRCSIDLDDFAVTNSWNHHNISGQIFSNMSINKQYTTVDQSTDGQTNHVIDYKIAYIRLHLRVATGEDETISAVSQTCRFVLWRSIETYTESSGNPAQDVDGMPNYPIFYGNMHGLWMDKTVYVHSWAADADTTSGGQAMIHRLFRPKCSDTMIMNADFVVEDNEKGTVMFSVIGDDPSGANSTYYGYIEIGYRYKTD